MDAATAATLSRVELEPILVRDLELGDEVSAEVIRTELASRVWQNVNPYDVAEESSSPTSIDVSSGDALSSDSVADHDSDD